MYKVKYCLDFIAYDEEDKFSCKTMREAVKFASSVVRWGVWNGAQGNTSFANIYNKNDDFVLCFIG